jgi:hypothetical protein
VTLLEQIAQERTNQTLYTALGATIEATAREISRELLQDPGFREELKTAARQSFRRAVRDLRRKGRGKASGKKGGRA